VLATEYAVRGPIVARAQELEKQGQRKSSTCNIGNPQSFGKGPSPGCASFLPSASIPL